MQQNNACRPRHDIMMPRTNPYVRTRSSQPISTECENILKADQILGKRLNKNILEFQVGWKGLEATAWVALGASNCPPIVFEYLAHRKERRNRRKEKTLVTNPMMMARAQRRLEKRLAQLEEEDDKVSKRVTFAEQIERKAFYCTTDPSIYFTLVPV